MRFAVKENADAATPPIDPPASAGRELRKGRVIPLESDVIERKRERMPTGFWIRFRADHACLRDHADRSSPCRAMHQFHLEVHRSTRFHQEWTSRIDSAGADIR